ncbi:ABC transporter permease [Thalassobaculum salexigens]|uniref:ABC transporter permease n=1 Tax=Thalassobaculum salexigens TaxID=455360 RepID=UPI00248ED3B5|nr:ABC transporter permease [Thalassobaculum salexigens]
MAGMQAVGATLTRLFARDRGGRPSPFALLVANPLSAFGLALLTVIVVLVIATPFLPVPDPDITDPANRLLRPGTDGHLLGTDHLGRDLLSRMLWGTRVSILVGLSATLIAATIGSLIGLVAGYAGGRTDSLLMRGIDLVMAFPYILLALAIVAGRVSGERASAPRGGSPRPSPRCLPRFSLPPRCLPAMLPRSCAASPRFLAASGRA